MCTYWFCFLKHDLMFCADLYLKDSREKLLFGQNWIQIHNTNWHRMERKKEPAREDHRLSRDRSRSVQEFNLSKSVPSQMSDRPKGQHWVRSVSTNDEVTVKIQKTRIHSESEVEVQHMGKRMTKIYKFEQNEDIRKVAITFSNKSLLYQFDQVCVAACLVYVWSGVLSSLFSLRLIRCA